MDNNVQLVKPWSGGEELLADDEWFALMVMDKYGLQHGRHERDYWDASRGMIGLERTDGRVYISKTARKRYNPLRGETWIVRVLPGAKTCILAEAVSRSVPTCRGYARCPYIRDCVTQAFESCPLTRWDPAKARVEEVKQ